MATNLSNLTNFLNRTNTEPKQIHAQYREHPLTPEAIIEKSIELGIRTEPLEIEEVVTHIFKMQIERTDLGKSVSGFLERIGDKWCIYINTYESPFRQRFTIAHELGHFILHRDKITAKGITEPDQIFFRSDTTDTIEQQANDFASKLLMPEDTFKNAIRNGDNTIDKLSNKFKLSTAAIKYRAYQLGLISEY